MFANERRIQITEMLNRRSSVTVNELTDTFQVSLETIRRDLEYLEKQGALKRVHGGAVTVHKMQNYISLSSRVSEHREEKRKLALASLPFIHEEDRIALDTGSTSFELASLLCERFSAVFIPLLYERIKIFRRLFSHYDLQKCIFLFFQQFFRDFDFLTA